ncbi:MAG: transporter, partial [Bacteroidota bacterium]
VAGKGSVKLATGSENITPPLGTGTVDYSLGTVAAWIGLKYGVYGDVSYVFNGSSEELSRGNSLTYNAAIGYRLIPAVYDTYPTQVVNLYLELNGKYASRDKLIGQEVANSGGNEVFVSPGIQYIPSRNFLVEGSVQIPVLNSLNGTQLGTDFMANLGVRLLLF